MADNAVDVGDLLARIVKAATSNTMPPLSYKQEKYAKPVTNPTKQAVHDIVPVMMRSHSPSTQLEQFRYLSGLFDPKGPLGDNPEAKLGAMKATADTIKSFNTYTNAAGITYHGNPDKPNALEQRIIKEAGLTPNTVANHILIAPDVMSGERKDTIKHELSHLGGFGEATARLLSIRSGENVKENMDFLKSNYDELDTPEKIAKAIKDRLPSLDKFAIEALKNVMKKREDQKIQNKSPSSTQ